MGSQTSKKSKLSGTMPFWTAQALARGTSDSFEWFDHARGCASCMKFLDPRWKGRPACKLGRKLRRAAQAEWKRNRP